MKSQYLIYVIAAVVIVGTGVAIFAAIEPFKTKAETQQPSLKSISPDNSLAAAVAPSFTLPSTIGGKISLSDYSGKKNVLLYFQEGIMCAPCWQQIEDIQKQYDKFKSLDIELVTITVDPLNALTKETKERGITLPVLEDGDLSVSKAYGVLDDSMHPGSRPGHTFVLVDKSGNIVWKKPYYLATGSTVMTMKMADGTNMTMDMGMDMGKPGSVMYVPVDNLLSDLKTTNSAFAANASEPNMTMQDHSMCLTPIHEHADFKVYLNGNPLNLAERKYMDQDRVVHFHTTVKVNPDDVPGIPFADMVHIHDENITINDFLNTLELGNDTFKMLADKQLTKVYVNGDLRPEGLDYVMQDKDRILVTSGNVNESEIAKEIESVTDYATMGKDKNPSLFGGC